MLTEKQKNKLNWEKMGNIIPVIIQHNITGEILMLGYMNDHSLTLTEKSGYVNFYSRSKNRIWKKGETSGNTLKVISIYLDCDGDTLLILVNPKGPTCHRNTLSCFNINYASWSFLSKLENLINERKLNNEENSYTGRLYTSGTKRIAQKLGEEGIETALASLTDDKNEIIAESADLIYHLLVLLKNKNLFFYQIINKLYERYLNKNMKVIKS